MDIQRYISSGVIENYVTGLLSADDMQELERLMLRYPEIRAAVGQCQEDMEALVHLNAVIPPPELKKRIIPGILEQHAVSNGQTNHAPKGPPITTTTVKRSTSTSATPVPNNLENHKNHSHVVPLSSNKIWRYAAVAALVLLACSLYFNFIYFGRYSTVKGRVAILSDRENKLTKNNEVYQTKMQDMEKELDLMKDPGFKWIKMSGVSGHAGSVATICWNPQTQVLYILPQVLPRLASDQQYQLWAIVNDQAVDAGVFSPEHESGTMLRMKNIARAQAFAVTLEKKGGNRTPSMEQLFVTGKVTQ
ncbi:anti-sigma factor [Chitinophaga pendula]|uniref:anti-sigma factor n=1 Tax=Chitinophaga TaxID=79328 RepID=UPI000BB0A2A8|nr:MULTISPECIES: anti-sigma factor [Chitinophaga]ASZ11498.1 hypothetical protein CK934_11295 [Chitinophaga sp. MD30]UCJ05491.1 anti-sigma factor [Chitinophaga pendula]